MQDRSAMVLVVEDDPETNDLLCDLLELEGYRVARTSRGDQALARIATVRVR